MYKSTYQWVCHTHKYTIPKEENLKDKVKWKYEKYEKLLKIIKNDVY